MIAVHSGIQDGDRLAGARIAGGPGGIGADERHTIREHNRNSLILLNADHQGIGCQIFQTRRVNSDCHQGDELEIADNARVEG